ncbi:3-ketoacyl-CoA synthase 20-like [Syzygium oleosum]|uniref:3-ketoacyl-CoA synthase 20-like n=1 Tax=Syzygium oleosum TaxID=219896 RepID=UPI0011D18B0C|nr:3-ketoacyl-CoA synthase 20-like [Syzygium oleosum]
MSSFDISTFTLEHVNLNSTGIFLLCLTLILFLATLLKPKYPNKVFLLDFVCYKAPDAQSCSKESFMEKARLYGKFSDATLDFMRKTLERSGLGESTYLPEALLRQPPNPCLEESVKEAEAAMFGAVDEVLAKTGVRGDEIGVLVVNCCIFNVVPSLSSMIVNRYKLKEDVLSYSLQGMGCSAGLGAIGLAKNLLQVHPNSYALVVSTENITENAYLGNDRSMTLINCLFRVGGAAILLSNRPSDARIAKYKLLHTVHTHTARWDRSYECIFQEEDPWGQVGVTITKDLMAVAINAIEANIAVFGRLILPMSEKILYAANCLVRRFHMANVEPYVPDFKKVVDHVFPHVGGKPVLDELEKSLSLSEAHMEASRMTLYRFGNTSSSSIWYALAYAEAKGKMKRGDRAWQIAFGSGFKCSSVIWEAIRTVGGRERSNPWTDEIDGFPVPTKNIEPIPYYFEPSKKKEA